MAAPSTIAAFALDPGKPDVPPWVPIDIGEQQGVAVGANLENLGDIKALASRVNRFNANQDIATLEQLFPGARDIIGQASETIQSQMRGEIPEDVQRQLTNLNAEFATAGGYGGSLFAGARKARDFGLTSLNLVETGMRSAERWLAASRGRVPLFNPAAMFVSPGMAIETAFRNQENQWNRDWLAENVDKSLGMFEQAIMNSMQQMDQLILQGTSMSMGSAMGGMGGGGGQFPQADLTNPNGQWGGWQQGFGQANAGMV